MLLAIDIGNSNVKFAVFTEGVQTALWRCATQTKRTSDEYAVFVASCARGSGLDLQSITGAIISSVVPEVTPLVEAACRQLFSFTPAIIGKTLTLPVKCLVDNPTATGSDRLVAIMAVRELYPLPALIVDFGTATTFTLINADGDYCGGAIAPGVGLSLRALTEAAAQLPKIDLASPPDVAAKNTIHAMQSGSYYGSIAMVEGMISRLSASFGEFSTIVASGGICPIFQDRIEGITTYDPNLNLTGLRFIYESFCV
jgi:type III pantothenate kinase